MAVSSCSLSRRHDNAARILVIEDNPPNLELMSYLLRAFGHDVTTATDGLMGLTAATDEYFDLIICDIQIPRIDGHEVARRLKKDPDRRHIPLVAVTAYAMVGDRDRVLGAGFNGYIPKPIAPEAFVGQVEAFLPLDRRSKGPIADSGSDVHESAAPSRRARVLIVDNDNINLELARGVLEPHGYQLETATSMADGLRRARITPPDLILSDVHMGDGSGFEFLREVLNDPVLRWIPFIMITSTYDNDRDRARALGAGGRGLSVSAH